MLRSPSHLRASGEAFGWIAFAVVLWAITYSFHETSVAYRLGTASWPRAVLVLLVFCAVVQWLLTIRAPAPAPVPAQPLPAAQPNSERTRVEVWSQLAMFVLPLVYAWLLPRSGFFATTPLFVGILLWLLGERRWWRLVCAAASIWCITLLLFSVLLYVPLPTGNWPVFYDFSNRLLSWLH